MNRDKREKESMNKNKDIKIDYENIDVSDIMLQIKRKIAKAPKRPPQEFNSLHPFDSPVKVKTEEEVQGIKGKLKKFLLKVMRPFSPFIKLMVLPVHEEVMETNRNLHWANVRLDNVEAQIIKIGEEIENRFNMIKRDLDRTIGYTKLLHNLSHNIVVELSKLKIEEEGLKLKSQIIEKDFEFLAKKEKALEKEIFK